MRDGFGILSQERLKKLADLFSISVNELVLGYDPNHNPFSEGK
jgi:hypothetical protein